MTHSMQLTPSPFQMIKEGTKTIELRLFDEKRRKIQIGDIIEFSNTETGEKIGAKVSAQYVFDSFESLYKELSLLECGYTEADIETASPDDMNVYYSKDNQQKYGVVGIRIALLYCSGALSEKMPVSTGISSSERVVCKSSSRLICFAPPPQVFAS